MMTTLQFCLCLTVALAGSLTVQTQGSQSIEDSIKTKEPAWEFSSPRREAEPKSSFYRWKSGQEWIDIRVFVTESPQAAAAKLKEFARHVPVPPKEKLRGRGNEALLYQSANTNGCMILFRRGKVFVHVNGSSLIHAKRFAGHLDDLFSQN